MSMIVGRDGFALVEVHGLPDGKAATFTYRTPRDVEIGEQVQVPAPEWSIKVTGRETLPGFVLGADMDGWRIPADKVREILPESSAPHPVPAESDLDKLIQRWTAAADTLDEEAHALRLQARNLEIRGGEMRHWIDQITAIRSR